MTRWPDAVWSAPVLRDLDLRARTEIAAAGELRAIGDGGHAYRAGDRAEALFAVIDGTVIVRSARGVLREVRAGETFGEEAIVAATALRGADAIATQAARVAVLPAALLRRALERADARSAERVGRTLRRTVAREKLRASPLGRALGDADLDVLLDAAAHVQLARGEAAFREGDPAGPAYVIADGMIETRRGSRLAERAILRAGAPFGHERAARAYTAVAVGPAWLLAIAGDVVRDVVAKIPGALARDAATVTGPRAGDPYRLEIARSLLVIDESTCIQCGHCAWSCATAHDDGIARLARRGDVIRATVEGAGVRALLVATSCQHCAVPACLPACPTGAITRGPSGEVTLRADLCTGCGACAKACPWDAVTMAPLASGANVAVKCDLCRSVNDGRGAPACVEGCPTGALVRIDPRATLREVRDARADAGDAPVATRPARAIAPAWPFVAVGAAAGLVAWRVSSRWESGAIAGAAFAALAALGAWKRVVRRAGRVGYVVHLAIAPIAALAGAKHVTRVTPNAAGALAIVSAVAIATGIALAIAHAVVPRRLGRIVRRGALVEDRAARAEEIEARAFAELTGRSESAKAVFARVLQPYARSRIGALVFAARALDPRREEGRLRALVMRLTADRASSIEGLDALIGTAVEARALAAERALHLCLRVFVAPHVVAAVIATVLLAVHVAIVARYR